MNTYMKVKYAKQPLTAAESAQVAAFLPAFIAQVKTRIPAGKRTGAFLNPARTLAYFIQPDEDDHSAA
jgi:hypothetical protein